RRGGNVSRPQLQSVPGHGLHRRHAGGQRRPVFPGHRRAGPARSQAGPRRHRRARAVQGAVVRHGLSTGRRAAGRHGLLRGRDHRGTAKEHAVRAAYPRGRHRGTPPRRAYYKGGAQLLAVTRPERGVIRDSLAHPAAIVAVGMFLIPMLTGFAGRALGQRLGYDMGQPFAFAALSTVMTAAQGVALTALTIWRVAGSHGLRLPLDALGLTARHWRREVAVGLRWGVALLAVNVVTSQLARRLYRLFM